MFEIPDEIPHRDLSNDINVNIADKPKNRKIKLRNSVSLVDPSKKNEKFEQINVGLNIM